MTTQNNYARLLLDPRWQKRRLEIMQRDHWRCIVCQAGNVTLTVHHTGYLWGWMPWDYPDDMLETLCIPHHNERHVFPLAKPDLCIWCGSLVTNENLGGRNGKHEFICEHCIRRSEERNFTNPDIQ